MKSVLLLSKKCCNQLVIVANRISTDFGLEIDRKLEDYKDLKLIQSSLEILDAETGIVFYSTKKRDAMILFGKENGLICDIFLIDYDFQTNIFENVDERITFSKEILENTTEKFLLFKKIIFEEIILDNCSDNKIGVTQEVSEDGQELICMSFFSKSEDKIILSIFLKIKAVVNCWRNK